MASLIARMAPIKKQPANTRGPSLARRRHGLPVGQRRRRSGCYFYPTDESTNIEKIYFGASVVRYLESLPDGPWKSASESSEPDHTGDVEVLLVPRKASHMDVLHSRDETHRKLLNHFDWDAMKIPVEEHSSPKPRTAEESSSGEETDSADESESYGSAVKVVFPKTIYGYQERPMVRQKKKMKPNHRAIREMLLKGKGL